MPQSCKIKENADIKKVIGKGYYEVVKERKGNLYVNIDNEINIIKNPYGEDWPKFVRVSKNKSGEYYIKK